MAHILDWYWHIFRPGLTILNDEIMTICTVLAEIVHKPP